MTESNSAISAKTPLFSANRIAALGAFLTSLGGAIVAITHTFPHSWQGAAIVIAGIIGAFGTAMTFMVGSWKNDQLQANIRVKELELAHAERIAIASTGITNPTPANTDIEKAIEHWRAILNSVNPQTTETTT